jgi:hypothetical protein
MKETLINKIFKKIISELEKEDRLDKISSTIFEPIVYRCIQSLYPYFIFGGVVIIILFILIISILFLNIKICYK